MSDDERRHEHEHEDEEAATTAFAKGPATPRQAILSIGVVFVFGVILGFLLCQTF
jgi:hypothetical protein